MDKKELRHIMINSRRRISHFEWKNKSNIIHNRLKNCEEFKRAKKIMLYVDYNNEVETKSLIKWCIENEKQIYLPVVAENNTMLASRVMSCDFEKHYKKDCYGIPEPKNITPIDPCELDLVITPMVASDANGYRLGYGGGYYDRFLEKTELDTIGICFDFQVVEKLPHYEFDQRIKKIITDLRVIESTKK